MTYLNANTTVIMHLPVPLDQFKLPRLVLIMNTIPVFLTRLVSNTYITYALKSLFFCHDY